MDNFSLYSNDIATNTDIAITYTPSINTVEYTYKIYKNDQMISVERVTSNMPSLITLDSTGTYQIKVLVNNGIIEYEESSGIYRIDKQAPELRVGASTLRFRIGDKLDVWSNVAARDNVDGDITKSITCNSNDLNLKKTGVQKLTYTVSDVAGNTTTKVVSIDVVKNQSYLLAIVQVAIIILLITLLKKMSGYYNVLKMEKRYAKYSVDSVDDDTPSLFDTLSWYYIDMITSLSQVVKKSKVLSKLSKRYNKYLIFTKGKFDDSTSIVASKMLSAIGFLIIAVTARALQYRSLTVYEVMIPIILGYYVPDVIYLFKYKFYYEKIENDLLQAVIIMNNAFKSGRSIVQAISLVGEELPGIVGTQFISMRRELDKGLALDVVFARFAERINIEEVNYMTASLTVLNKTGGNIIKVFSSIENSLFMKKKLKLELKSLTSSSKIIMWVLFLIPIAYVFIISILNPMYFDPFFKDSLGLLLLLICAIFYAIYIIIVSKILKVRM